jgi:hypothetical protein
MRDVGNGRGMEARQGAIRIFLKRDAVRRIVSERTGAGGTDPLMRDLEIHRPRATVGENAPVRDAIDADVLTRKPERTVADE